MSNARNLAKIWRMADTTIQTANLARLRYYFRKKLADAAVTATKLPSGSVLQVVRYSETNTQELEQTPLTTGEMFCASYWCDGKKS